MPCIKWRPTHKWKNPQPFLIAFSNRYIFTEVIKSVKRAVYIFFGASMLLLWYFLSENHPCLVTDRAPRLNHRGFRSIRVSSEVPARQLLSQTAERHRRRWPFQQTSQRSTRTIVPSLRPRFGHYRAIRLNSLFYNLAHVNQAVWRHVSLYLLKKWRTCQS